MKKGFTIFETLIYISLLSLLLVGTFISAYSLIESAKNLEGKNTIYSEGNFVLQKLRWVFSNTQSITSPSEANSNSQTLTVVHHDGTTVTMRKNGSLIEISESGPSGTFYPLTTQNVSVSDVNFFFIKGFGESGDGVTASITINGIVFSVTKYIKK